MTFDQAEAYLVDLIDERRSRGRLGLDRMRALLHELGNPQDGYATVHVAGTSGKGSTATMIAAAMRASGKRTGLHTKPHLHSVTERAWIDGAAIGEERFAELLDAMIPTLERVTAIAGRPSYYEALLALAFLYFALERVDVAVIEVGLGGRLDGTNVIVPKVGVITSVGYDHTEILGESIAAIAAEKAGIAKAMVPLVVGVENREAIDVIERIAAKAGAPMTMVDEVSEISRTKDERNFVVTTASARYDVRLPVFGAFQRRNAQCAIVALEALPAELRPSSADVERGLSTVAIPGRMEIFPGAPTAVLDIAHNAEKSQHLADALREHYPAKKFHAIVAIGQGKDARAILAALAPLAESVTFTSFAAAGRHAITPPELVSIAQSLGVRATHIDDSREAFESVREQMPSDGIILVTGSTFIVSEIRAMLGGELFDKLGVAPRA
jgi:dihydrofolate synthase / folylpolyglutamate synthase